jgi:hypothetical protein
MSNKKSPQNNMKTILRGLKEVARITLAKKPPQTNLHTEAMPEEKKDNAEQGSDEKVRLARIQDGNELIIAPEYLEEMRQFFNNHAILDTYRAPCYYNNDSCDAVLCVFPRIVRPTDKQMVVKDVISMTIEYNGTIVAMSEYHQHNSDSVEQFNSDIARLTPKYYQSIEQVTNAYQDFRNKFPDAYPSLPDDPIFHTPQYSPDREETINETVQP